MYQAKRPEPKWNLFYRAINIVMSLPFTDNLPHQGQANTGEILNHFLGRITLPISSLFHALKTGSIIKLYQGYDILISRQNWMFCSLKFNIITTCGNSHSTKLKCSTLWVSVVPSVSLSGSSDWSVDLGGGWRGLMGLGMDVMVEGGEERVQPVQDLIIKPIITNTPGQAKCM